jgi:hypothetical protein
MSRDELYEDICKKLEIIRTTESMKELDIAHVTIRDRIEQFALAHRRRLNFETDHKGYPENK